jgi:hypothetical protein
MKLERSNVEFAIWRKKVDKSLFEHNGTTIPEWACRMWGLQQLYGNVTSRKDSRSEASAIFKGISYSAWVTTAPHGRSSPAFRLWFDRTLAYELKSAFVMSYMRSLEGSLDSQMDPEEEIPFWEFLDIEFDSQNRIFRFVAYYRVQPSFPNLFKRLVGSPALRRIEDEVQDKEENRIHKQDWKARSELEYELGATNVLYMLYDSKARLFYMGEAENLVKRLLQPHSSIEGWDFFRYNVLPQALAPYRVAIERMLIRDFAAILKNKRDIPWYDLGGCCLANDKIDR